MAAQYHERLNRRNTWRIQFDLQKRLRSVREELGQ